MWRTKKVRFVFQIQQLLPSFLQLNCCCLVAKSVRLFCSPTDCGPNKWCQREICQKKDLGVCGHVHCLSSKWSGWAEHTFPWALWSSQSAQVLTGKSSTGRIRLPLKTRRSRIGTSKMLLRWGMEKHSTDTFCMDQSNHCRRQVNFRIVYKTSLLKVPGLRKRFHINNSSQMESF